MTRRSLLPLSLLLIPLTCGTIAATQLLSIDASVVRSPSNPAPVLVETTPPATPPTQSSEVPAVTPTQTAQERYNTVLSRLQDGDWLMQQGKFKAAKLAYQDALAQSTVHPELAAQGKSKLADLEDRQQRLIAQQTQSQTQPSKSQPKTQSPAKPAATPSVKLLSRAQPVAQSQTNPPATSPASVPPVPTASPEPSRTEGSIADELPLLDPLPPVQ